MKTFGELTYNDKIYRVDKNGIAVKYDVYGIQDYYYSNNVVFTFADRNTKTPQLIKNESVFETNDSCWFANLEDATIYLKEITDRANKILQNCLESKMVFSN